MSHLPTLKIVLPMAIATAVAVALIARGQRRLRRELGGEIQAATIVVMSSTDPPSPTKLRLVEQRTDDIAVS